MANTSASGGYLTPTSAPPPEDAAFDAIIQALAAGVTGLPANLVRPRWQQIPAPFPEVGTDWCALGVVDEVPIKGQMISQHQPSANSGNGQTAIQTFAIVQVLASFYGPNARGNASLLRDGLMVGQNREALQLQNIGLVEMPGPVRFIPEIINQQTQRRADISFLLIVPYIRVFAILNLLAAQGTVISDDGNEQAFLVTDLIDPELWLPLPESAPAGGAMLWDDGGFIAITSGTPASGAMLWVIELPTTGIGSGVLYNNNGRLCISSLDPSHPVPWIAALSPTLPAQHGEVWSDNLALAIS